MFRVWDVRYNRPPRFERRVAGAWQMAGDCVSTYLGSEVERSGQHVWRDEEIVADS